MCVEVVKVKIEGLTNRCKVSFRNCDKLYYCYTISKEIKNECVNTDHLANPSIDAKQ